jgi:hypothetical protein
MEPSFPFRAGPVSPAALLVMTGINPSLHSSLHKVLGQGEWQ